MIITGSTKFGLCSWLGVILLSLAVACGDPAPSNYPTEQVFLEDTALGPRDLFEVRVYEHEDLSQLYEVSPEGSINFPLIGKVEVAGKSRAQLEDIIRGRLADGFLVNPSVSVLVKEYRSKTISVLGQVRKPGSMPYQENMSVVRAISEAGGFTPMARKNAVTVTREVAGKKTNYTVPVDKISNGSAPNMYLRPGDVVYAPERIF